MKPTGRTFIREVPVSRLGFGTAPLGGLFTKVSDQTAEQTVAAAYQGGVRFFDTAPLYGYGSAEQRLGRALSRVPRDSYTVATKVGRLIREVSASPEGFDVDTTQMDHGEPIYKSVGNAVPVFDFSYDGALKSIEESLARLGMDRLDLVHVHDPDNHMDQAIEGALRALLELRDSGVIGAVGVGIDNVDPAVRFVRETDIDCLLIAGRWTLLDRNAGKQLLPEAERRGVAIIAAGVFNSGLLADPVKNKTFDYAAAPAAMVTRAHRMQELCAEHGKALAAAAVQFPLRHPAVRAVIVGARTPAEIQQTLQAASVTISDELWEELDLVGVTSV